ncbi:hypothetical protein C0992_001846, partial [Termitomyces sp. T32_za158]
MKRLFTQVQVQASKPFTSIPKTLAGLAPSASPGQIGAQVGMGLQPKYVVPPIPHPCPYDHLVLVVAREGLLMRQHVPGRDRATERTASYVRVAWANPVRIEEVVVRGDGDGVDERVDWSGSVVVYGVVGVLELFSLIDGSHTVYNVKGVTAIPLVEDKARVVLSALALKNAKVARPSLIASTTLDTLSDPRDDHAEGGAERPRSPEPSTLSSGTTAKYVPPVDPSRSPDLQLQLPSAQSSSSDLSSSDHSVAHSPVAKTLAARLSFWSRLSTRPLVASPTTEDAHVDISGTTSFEGRESLDKIIEDGKTEPAVVLNGILAATAPPPASSEEKHSELEAKIVRECVKEFAKGEMYFSYNFDITRSLQHKQDQIAKAQKQHELLADLDALPSAVSESFQSPVEGLKVSPMSEPNPTLPLWRRVDRRFWWNEWLSKSFVDAGLHSYVLPIMQGYYQVAHFVIPPDPMTHDEDVLVDYIVISRRSRYRAGLRYQRRGIDDDANVANFVETETITRVNRLGVENIFAYVQIRGSIPLFWTQTGYGLKPPPLLASDRTHAQNLNVLRRHFEKTVALYGPHNLLNLAEQHGKEGAVTDAYRQYVRDLDSPNARYHEYDFHEETKGMKYENISKLVEAMGKVFDAQGYLWISDNVIMAQQRGVWRLNCIDCLDRTNVVQSAFARHVLNKQLGAVALLNPQGETRTDTDVVFNE